MDEKEARTASRDGKADHGAISTKTGNDGSRPDRSDGELEELVEINYRKLKTAELEEELFKLKEARKEAKELENNSNNSRLVRDCSGNNVLQLNKKIEEIKVLGRLKGVEFV